MGIFMEGNGGNMAIKLISKHKRKQQKLNQSKQAEAAKFCSFWECNFWFVDFPFFPFKPSSSVRLVSWRLSDTVVRYHAAQRVYLYRDTLAATLQCCRNDRVFLFTLRIRRLPITT